MVVISLVEYQQLRERPRAKSGWRTINGQEYYFRSTWEANYARYLDFLVTSDSIQWWEYEPETFWFEKIKRGTRSYLPDFKIYNADGSHHWVEVKGYMDAKSKTKIKRFHKYYPKEKLIVVDKTWFKENKKHAQFLGWE